MNRKPTPQLNRKELELISAYLDGQLPEAQRRELRQRLAQDAAFKQAFEDLRLTRLALRSAPQIKRRRSFTLTPEMVGVRPARGFSLQTASRLVAVVATVLLVAVFVGDVFLMPRAGSQLAFDLGANNAEEMYVENAANLDVMEGEPSGAGGEPPLAAAQGVGDEDVAEEEADDMAAAAPAEPAVEEGAATAAAEAVETLGEEDGDDSDAAEDGADFLAPTPKPPLTSTPEGTKAPEVQRAVPTDEVGEVQEAEEVVAAEAEVIEGEPDVKVYDEEELEVEIPWLLFIELGLLALALGSGAVALLTRRR
jgi:hypothetical protein